MMMGVMGHAHSETDDPNSEGEGVWSPEIEQAFQKALEMFPPCGRRKHILQEEGGGKMYGRNELIARYIEQTTGHRRTRKQVSSHIQVLSRREARNKANSRGGDTDSVSPASSMTASSIGGGTERVLSRPDSATSGSGYSGNMNTMITPMDIVTSNKFNSHHQHPHHHHHLNHFHNNHLTNNNNHHLTAQTNQHPISHQQLNTNGQLHISRLSSSDAVAAVSSLNPYDFWEDRPIMTRKIRLVEFSAFVEQRKQATVNSNSSRSTAALTQAAMLASLADSAGGGGHLPPGSRSHTTTLDTSMAAQLPSTTNPHLSAQLAAAAYTQQQQANLYGGYTNGRTSELLNGGNNMTSAMAAAAAATTAAAAAETGTGFHRHSYVKIDYRQLSERQAMSKMERIDIHKFRDKFPDIDGPEDLYARGSPDSFFLVKFWADLDHDAEHLGLFEDQNSYFGFSTHFETPMPFKDITCSTKACSYGHQVVEKVEKVYGTFNSSNNTYSYAINKSPMCEFMIQFIRKLRQLPELALMNRILENFTVLQLVTCESTSEILMCIAYVFEIAPPRHTIPGGGPGGSHYHVYKLTKDRP